MSNIPAMTTAHRIPASFCLDLFLYIIIIIIIITIIIIIITIIVTFYLPKYKLSWSLAIIVLGLEMS